MKKIDLFKSSDVDDMIYLRGDEKVTFLNEKLRQWLEQNGKVLYGPSTTIGPENWNEQPSLGDTHTGILICIEKLEREPCKHEPVFWLEGSDKYYGQRAKCKHCNAKLTATWEAVSE